MDEDLILTWHHQAFSKKIDGEIRICYCSWNERIHSKKFAFRKTRHNKEFDWCSNLEFGLAFVDKDLILTWHHQPFSKKIDDKIRICHCSWNKRIHSKKFTFRKTGHDEECDQCSNSEFALTVMDKDLILTWHHQTLSKKFDDKIRICHCSWIQTIHSKKIAFRKTRHNEEFN